MTWLPLLLGAALAQDDPTPPDDPPPELAADEQPPPAMPPDREADWVMLVSGEWLRGNIERMRSSDLSFDSDELDDLTLDFDDIDAIYTTGDLAWVGVDLQSHVGPAVLKDGVVTIQTGGGDVVMAKGDVLSLVEAATREIQHWSYDLTLGISGSGGATNQASITVDTSLVRATKISRTKLGYLSNIGQTDGEVTAFNQNGTLKTDLFVSPILYLNVFNGSITHDRFQNLDILTTIGAAFGVTLLDTSVTWEEEAGPVYQLTRFISVEPDQDQVVQGIGAMFTSTLEWEPNGDWDLGVSNTATVIMNDYDLSTYFSRAYIEVDVTGALTISANGTWTRLVDPKADSTGTTPAKDSLTYYLGLGISI